MWGKLKRHLEWFWWREIGNVIHLFHWLVQRQFEIGAWLFILVIWIIGTAVIIPYIQNGLENNIDRIPLTVGVLGALSLGTVGLLGLYFNYRRTRAFEKQLEQQLYTTNVEHLGHISESVRLGGIYGLERLAKESRLSDKPWGTTVAEILCAHIRLTTTKDNYGGEMEIKPSNEIVAILKVLTRVGNPFIIARFDLSGADLTGVNLRRADLRNANFKKTNLTRADLSKAYLNRANLTEADLTETNLTEADLKEVIGLTESIK